MSEHTKEPWAVAPSNDGGQHIGNVDGMVVIYQNRKNMDRIVACVNACAGINPEAVPEMLEALRGILDGIVATNKRNGIEEPFGECIDAARAALAKAKAKHEHH